MDRITVREAGMREKELAIITTTYDLVKWSCQHTGKFPRNHRFVLGERIERRLYDLLETLIQARYTRARQPLLRQPNLSLEVLRFQMRLAHDLQCLRTNSYRPASQGRPFQALTRLPEISATRDWTPRAGRDHRPGHPTHLTRVMIKGRRSPPQKIAGPDGRRQAPWN
jgi:hypothetical protein